MQVRKAGSKIFMVCKYYSDYLLSIYNTSTSKFSSIYITKRTILDAEYSKTANSISLITTQSTGLVPEIYSYSLDYAFSDTSIFTYSAVEWSAAPSTSAYYVLSSVSSTTFTIGTPSTSLYTWNLASNPDISLSSSAYGYFQGYFTSTNIQKYTLTIDNTGTFDPNLSCLSNSATTVVYSLQSYNGGSVPSFVKINTSTGVLTVSAPSSSSSDTFYLRETYSGDYSMTIDHIVTIEVQDPTPTCLGLRIDNYAGCVVTWIVIIYFTFFILAGIIFTINYFTWIKSHVAKLRIEKEIRNLPPAGDEDEENGENEVQHSHS